MADTDTNQAVVKSVKSVDKDSVDETIKSNTTNSSSNTDVPSKATTQPEPTNSNNNKDNEDVTSKLQTFLQTKLKYEALCRKHDWEIPIYHLPPIVRDELNSRRAAKVSKAKGEIIDLTENSEETHDKNDSKNETKHAKINPAEPKVIQEFISHYKSGEFKPTYITGSAFSILIELGQIPKSTQEIIRDVNANCYSLNFAGTWKTTTSTNGSTTPPSSINTSTTSSSRMNQTGNFDHLPLQTMIQRHHQDVRILRYNEMIQSLCNEFSYIQFSGSLLYSRIKSSRMEETKGFAGYCLLWD